MSVKKSDWFKQSNKLRRTLRRIDPNITAGVKDEIRKAAEHIHFDAISNAMSQRIVDRGDMIASIAIKYGRDGLTAVIGPGAEAIRINKSPFDTGLYKSDRSKYIAWQFFKGYWAEFGTKGTPKKNIPPQTARPFMQPAFDTNKAHYSKSVQRAVNSAIEEASRGSDIDHGPRST